MGKILTRAERTETEFPGVVTEAASAASDMAMPKSTWLKGSGFKRDTVTETQTFLPQYNNQHYNDRTQAVIPKDECVNEDFTEHERKRTREVDSIPLESFSDDWWKNSRSCEDDFPPYDIDQAEEPPYWLNYEPTDNREVDTYLNNTLCTVSDLTEQDTAFKSLHVQGMKDKNNTSTTTEEKIQSLKALLAEQEKAISRLKNESRDRNFESKEFLTSLKEDQSYNSLGKPVLCENERDLTVKSQHGLIKCKNGVYKVHKPLPKYKSRKRMASKHTGLSNTKRFRYNFRKDLRLDNNSYLDRKTNEKDSLYQEEITFKADIRKEALTQNEFLSFFGLVRVAREVTRNCEEIL